MNTTGHNYFPHSARIINLMLRLHILSRNIRIRIGHRKKDHLRMWIRRSNCTWKQPSSKPSFEILHGNYHICSGTYQKNFKRLRGISSVSEVYYTSTYEAKRESKWATSDTFLGVCYSHHAVPPLSGFFVCRIKLPLFELFIITTVSVPLNLANIFASSPGNTVRFSDPNSARHFQLKVWPKYGTDCHPMNYRVSLSTILEFTWEPHKIPFFDLHLW